MKVERFIKEYASHKAKQYKEVAKANPHQEEECAKRIEQCNKAVWMRERGYATEDEAIRFILEA